MNQSNTKRKNTTTKTTANTTTNSAAKNSNPKTSHNPTTKTSEKLTLYDRLSHLTYRQACDILGKEGAGLMRRPISLDNFNLKEDVYLGEDFFRLTIRTPNPDFDSDIATVTITLADKAKHKLATSCSICNPTKEPNRFCPHVATALSFLLEEKSLIGLAEIPDLETPPELLSLKKLRQRALHERRQRAANEKFTIIKSENTKEAWTDYHLTSELSGKTYRVALRGAELGDSFCSCPDFKTNRLGTCKHILYLLNYCTKKFGANAINKKYVNNDTIVYLRYGEHRTLHLELPDRVLSCDCEVCAKVKKIAEPFLNKSIDDVVGLISATKNLESLDFSVTIYPDADQWIQDRLFQNRISSLVSEIRANPKTHRLRKELLNVELLPYQLDGIAFAVGAGRAVLADDMGLGKTIQGIGVAELLANEVDIKKVLIVCPASVKQQWKSEIARFAPHRSTQLVLGGADERFEQYGNDTFFTICNYEQVLRDLIPIEQTQWDFIILDEGQRIKNWESKTTRTIKALHSTYALVLSGTPLENRLDDLYSVVQFVDDRRLLPAYRFFHRHRIVEDSGRVAGYKNLAELREELKPILLRRTKESVQLDLPERTVEVIRVAPTSEQVSIHAFYMQTVASIVAKRFLTEMDILRLQKALLAARMSADSTFLVDKQEPGYSSKLERLNELFAELFAEGDRKIVLFSEWTTMLNLIEELLKKFGVRYVRLDGSVPQKKRLSIVREFVDESDCVVFLTTNAGSVGLNLQAANTVINVDLPWNPAVLEQRIGRAHRMGQRRHVQVFLLVTEGTIEEQMLRTISAKQELSFAALDVCSEVSEVMLTSGVEELKRRLEVLLGSRPAAPIDQSQQQAAAATSTSTASLPQHTSTTDTSTNQDNTAEPVKKQDQIHQAGNNIINSIIQFANVLLGSESSDQKTNSQSINIPQQNQIDSTIISDIQKTVSDSIKFESTELGSTKLSITIPDQPTIENLLQTGIKLFNSLLKQK
ncbi:MAG: DEAD/DEAH box helicase [Planctomycetaceae bacterium]|jgi:hypothetical protein|nr:DEAD/DEAH box helicase [Planctomycetaceae bacterium]